MTFLSPPVRQPLSAVGSTKYNERLSRARSHNSVAHKLPAQASPAPRSPAKERPVRESSAREKPPKEKAAPPAEELKVEAPLEGEVPSFKKNPFLMADKKAKAPPPMPANAEVSRPPKAPPAAKVVPAEAEPRPIGSLSERQRDMLQTKRKSLVQQQQQQQQLAKPAPAPVQEPEQQLEPVDEQAPAAQSEEQQKAANLAGPDEEEEAEPELGVQVMPVMSAVPVGEEAAREPVTTVIIKSTPPPAETGDLPFLRPGTAAPTELAAALSLLLPTIDREIAAARAVDATAEPLLDVVRRIHGKPCAKRKRR